MKQNNVSSKNGFAGCRYRAAIVTGKAGTAAAATASSLMRSQSFVEFFVQPEMFLFYILQHFVCLRFCFVVNCDSWHAIQQWQHSCRFLFLLKHSSCVVIINSNDYLEKLKNSERKGVSFFKIRMARRLAFPRTSPPRGKNRSSSRSGCLAHFISLRDATPGITQSVPKALLLLLTR